MYLQLILAARYLWGRKLRTFLTTLAVMFGVLVIFGTNTMLPSMLAALQGNMLAAAGEADVTIRQKLDGAFAPLLVATVASVPGVQAAAGSLQRTVNIPAGYFGQKDQVGALTLIGIDPDAARSVRTYHVSEGRFLNADDGDVAVITTSLAQALHLQVGDSLRMPTVAGVVDLRIIGLLPARALPGNEEVLVNLPEAQRLLAMPERINTIEASLNTANAEQRAAITQAIEAALGPGYQTKALAAGGQIYAALQMGEIFFGVVGLLVLFMGGFIILNTFRTVIAERRHDIGMLRALGASRRTILGLVLTEGLLQGVSGTLVGMVLGYLLGVGIIALINPMLGQYVHFEIGGPVVSTGLVVWTALLGVGVTVLAGLLPALAASRVTPLEALRPPVAEPGSRFVGKTQIAGVVLLALAALGLLSGRVGFIALGAMLLLVGLVLVAPVLVRPVARGFGRLLAVLYAREGVAPLAQGNLARQPGRAAITASATMVGLAIIIAVAGAMTSIMGWMQGTIEKSLGSDYVLLPPAVGVWGNNLGANEDLAASLRAVPGVQAVSTLRFAQSEIGGQAVSVLGIDPAAFPQVAGLDVTEGDPDHVYAEVASGRNLIANWILAGQLGLHVGDVVHLSTPAGAEDYDVVGIAGDFYNAKLATVYISQANLQADFGKTEDVLIQINRSPDAKPEEVEPRLRAVAERYPQFQFISGQALRDQIVPQFRAIVNGLYVALAVLAVPSLIALLNTLAIGVIERMREIGMLRAIGATRRQVRRLVITEALLLAGLGTALGVVAGVYLAYTIVQGTAVAGFPVTFSFPLGGIISAIVVGLTFGVLAALVPARQAARLQIVQVLRYE